MVFLFIIFICYFTVALIRSTAIRNEWLPLISGSIGLVLGTIAFYLLPSITPVESVGYAIVYGFFSGLAATGSNQVFKQAVKYIAEKYNIFLVSDHTDDEESSNGK